MEQESSALKHRATASMIISRAGRPRQNAPVPSQRCIASILSAKLLPQEIYSITMSYCSMPIKACVCYPARVAQALCSTAIAVVQRQHIRHDASSRSTDQNRNAGSTSIAHANLDSSDLLKIFSMGTSLRLHLRAQGMS